MTTAGVPGARLNAVAPEGAGGDSNNPQPAQKFEPSTLAAPQCEQNIYQSSGVNIRADNI